MSNIKSGLIWSFVDSFGSNIVGLCISLYLATKLGPEVFGRVAMLSIFIAIANLMVNSGMTAALIRKKNVTNDDLATTFYFCVFISFFIYLILYISSPIIAIFYDEPLLINLLRVLAVIVVLNSFIIVPKIILSRNLNFRVQAHASILSILMSGFAAIKCQYFAPGEWALVLQQVVFACSMAILLNLFTKYSLGKFSIKSFKQQYSFGSKLFFSSLIDTIYNNIYIIIIGKYFSASQLGLYDQANRLTALPAVTISHIVQKVSYPHLSFLNNNNGKVIESFWIYFKGSAIIIFPLIVGIALIADDFVDLVLGSAWEGTEVVMKILAISFVLYPIHALNLNILQTIGRSDIYLKLEIIKKIAITLTLTLTVPHGMLFICYGIAFNSILAFFLNSFYIMKYSGIDLYNQCFILLKILAITFFALLPSKEIGLLVGSGSATLFITIMLSIIFYISLIIIFEKKFIKSLNNFLKQMGVQNEFK